MKNETKVHGSLSQKCKGSMELISLDEAFDFSVVLVMGKVKHIFLSFDFWNMLLGVMHEVVIVILVGILCVLLCA